MFLAVCATVKNEELYIEEWLEHHLLHGVEHFYIFDNDSTDDTRKKLALYEKEGLVTVKEIHGLRKQKIAYDMAIKWNMIESKWVAFIDVDEFLFSPLNFPIPQVIKNYKGASIITAHWVLYGSSGLNKYDDRLVTERFIFRASRVDQHCKSICLVDDLKSTGNNVHTFRTRGIIVNEQGKVLDKEYALGSGATTDFIRINHYHTKSREEAFIRWNMPRADTGGNRANEEHFIAHDLNEFTDNSLARYAPKIRKSIEERQKQWKAA